MKRKFYSTFQKGIVRIATTHCEQYVHWSNIAGGSLENASQFLIDFFAEQKNNDALYIASKSLWSNHSKALSSKISDEERLKLAVSLSSYFSRMCFRCTPFGGFASVRGVNVANSLSLGKFNATDLNRHVRIDSELLYSLSRSLLSKHRKNPGVKYRLNGSLLKVRGGVRYYETILKPGVGSIYRLAKVNLSDPLNLILSFNKSTWFSFEDVVTQLIAEFGDEFQNEIIEYVEDLISSQVLVSSLTLPITVSGSVTNWLACQLDKIDGTDANVIRRLDKATRKLANDGLPVEVISREIESILNNIQVDLPKDLIQVDQIVSGSQGDIPKSLVDDINDAIRLGSLLFRDESNSQLDKFKDNFLARYGTHFVPLMNVLDEDAGVISSNNSSLMSGILAEINWSNDNNESLSNLSLFELMLAALQEHCFAEEINLTSIIDSYFSDSPDIKVPEVTSALLKVHGANLEGIEAGNYLVEIGGGGPCGGFLLSRFAYGSDFIAEVGLELAKLEADRHLPSLVELVYQPIERLANVSVRPAVRDYELEILAQSGIDDTRRLGLDDILIGVLDNRIILWSETLGREIFVRHSTAYNSELPRNLGVFQMLCRLQWQNRRLPLNFSLENSKFAKYLPRIVYKNVLIRRASWTIPQSELEALRKSTELQAKIDHVIKKFKLPRHIILGSGDNKIVFDLLNPIACMDFLKRAKGDFVQVEEAFPRGLLPWFKSDKGHHNIEFVLPLIRSDKPLEEAIIQKNQIVIAGESFAPGSNWLSIKIYTGLFTRDQIISEVLSKIFIKFIRTKCWFFVRYNDPDTHLRLRVRLENSVEFLEHLHTELDSQIGLDRVHRILTDVYVPEVYRYGGSDAMNLVEQIFHLDSNSALKFLSSGTANSEELFDYTISCINNYFVLFEIDTGKQCTLLKEMQRDMYQLLKASKKTRGEVGLLFRRKRAKISESLSKQNSIQREFAELAKPIVVKLIILAKQDSLTVSIDSIIRSLIHMSINRLLSAASQQQEAVFYDLLYRHKLAEIEMSRNLIV